MTDSTDNAVERAAPSRPMRKDAARNRAALIAAAREVFAERGLDASLDDIAHRAGVGVGPPKFNDGRDILRHQIRLVEVH